MTALVASGCGSTDCSFTATCLSGASPVPDAGEDAPIVVPTDCDLKKSPKDSPACVDDGAGIFVSAAGKPDAKGSKLDPVPTIAAALARAAATKRTRVYVCDGKYEEPIKLTSAISVYGGFECSWKYTGAKPLVRPTSGIAIGVESVVDEVVLEDIDAMGTSDATIKGSSAIGALVAGSKLTMRRVAITAGVGQDGAKGASQSNYSSAAAAGNPASGATGGDMKPCSCADGTKSTGGHGADGNGGNFSDGSAVPALVNGNAGSSGTMTCNPGTVGLPGEPDVGGEPIQPPGVIVPGGWDATPVGGSGKNGRPGQGGGGGGAKTASSAAGGGGGCGGCGGAGAVAGMNGGASIGVIAVDSAIVLEGSTVGSSAGGKGGAGGDGQSGQNAAGGGIGTVCDGGPGGPGAGGSGGAGGAGGDSLAIAWKGGTAPQLTATDAKPGSTGKPGEPGAFGASSGKPGKPGKVGIGGRAQAVFTQ